MSTDNTRTLPGPKLAGAAGSARPFAQRAADALAFQCARAVWLGHVGSRSGIADALLDYLDVGGVDGPTDVIEWMLEYERQQSPNAQRERPAGDGQ